jgi:hypothetical protein
MHKDLHTDKSMIVTISEWMRSDVFGFVSLKVCDVCGGLPRHRNSGTMIFVN